MIQLLLDSVTPLAYRHNGHLGSMAATFHQAVMVRLARHVADHPYADELFRQNEAILTRTPPAASACWQPEIGATLGHLKQNRPVAAVVQALFGLHALRIAGNWIATLEQPVRVSMGGHLFDLQGDVSIDAAPDRIRVRALRLEPLTFAWSGTAWTLSGEAPHALWRYAAPAFFAYAGFENSYVQTWEIPPAAAPSMDLRLTWPQQPASCGTLGLGPAVAAQMDDVFGLLDQIGPTYVPWCQPVLRGIAACPSFDPEMRSSASYSEHAGIVSAAFPLSTPHLAEILVHELSHQYYLMLNVAMPLLRKEASKTLHYSSLKNRQRPLDMLFFAYHATSNMALFWHDVLAASTPHTALAAEELARQVAHTESLDANIAASGGLSEAGQAMFEGQRTLLRERRLIH